MKISPHFFLCCSLITLSSFAAEHAPHEGAGAGGAGIANPVNGKRVSLTTSSRLGAKLAMNFALFEGTIPDNIFLFLNTALKAGAEAKKAIVALNAAIAVHPLHTQIATIRDTVLQALFAKSAKDVQQKTARMLGDNAVGAAAALALLAQHKIPNHIEGMERGFNLLEEAKSPAAAAIVGQTLTELGATTVEDVINLC